MIYLDHNATTPLAPEVVVAMQPWLGGAQGRASGTAAAGERLAGNPQSAHAAGQAARAAVDAARAALAASLGCAAGEVVFTSGGTEAAALGLVGAALAGDALRGRRRVVVSAIEHTAVLEAARLLERLGFEVERVAPAAAGAVPAQAFLDACTPATVVASLMLASNETGVVQPVVDVGAELAARGVRFHTDAAQAIGKLALRCGDLPVDLLSLSAHKFGGPQGIGALVVRHGCPLVPLAGGTQEAGRRGGTPSVAGIAGLGAAARQLAGRIAAMPALGARRDRLERALRARLDDVRIHGSTLPRVPNTSLIAFGGVDAQALLVRLDLAGVCVSRGAACATGVEEPSHVLRAMGVEEAWARGTIRISMGIETRDTELDAAVEHIVAAVGALRAAGCRVPPRGSAGGSRTPVAGSTPP